MIIFSAIYLFLNNQLKIIRLVNYYYKNKNKLDPGTWANWPNGQKKLIFLGLAVGCLNLLVVVDGDTFKLVVVGVVRLFKPNNSIYFRVKKLRQKIIISK